LDATHFRQRAARARVMAQSGDDIRLSRMLLDVALDLDAEAEAMEAKHPTERRRYARLRPIDVGDAVLHMTTPDMGTRPAKIIDLSFGGAKIRVDRLQTPGSKVTLELPSHSLRLDGTVLRARATETIMVFDPAASASPGLSRLLRTETVADRAEVC
jgi:PilZ domain